MLSIVTLVPIVRLLEQNSVSLGDLSNRGIRGRV